MSFHFIRDLTGHIILFFCFYKFLVSISIKKLIARLKLRNEGISVIGKVTEYKETKDSEGDITYKPLIEFTSNEGYFFRFYSNGGLFKPAIGEEVKIKYKEDDPSICMLDNNSSLFFSWFMAVFSTVIFIILLCNSIIYFKNFS